MRLSTLSLLALLAASPALAEETVLTLEGGIAATLNMPDGDGPFPAVLMLHGFGSSRDEVGMMYANEAAALAEKGVASMRIDFRGFGKSDGDTGFHTVDRQNEDAQVGLNALLGLEGIDAEHVGVLGFSFGGGAAIELAAANPEQVAALALWSSVGDYHTDFLQSMSQDTFDRAAADGIVGLDLGWRTIALKSDFFDSLAGHDLMASLSAYPGPMLTVTGSDDYYVKYGQPMADAAGGDAQMVVMEGGDHIYHVFDPDNTMSKDVIDQTADWLAQNLAQ